MDHVYLNRQNASLYRFRRMRDTKSNKNDSMVMWKLAANFHITKKRKVDLSKIETNQSGNITTRYKIT